MAQISEQYIVSGMLDDDGARALKTELSRLPGVTSVSVNHEKSRVTVDFDDTGADRSDIERVMAARGLGMMS